MTAEVNGVCSTSCSSKSTFPLCSPFLPIVHMADISSEILISSAYVDTAIYTLSMGESLQNRHLVKNADFQNKINDLKEGIGKTD